MQIPKVKRVRLHGDALRELVDSIFVRDHHRCIVCGAWVEDGVKPHHFPQGALKSDEADHMVLLCYRCHGLAHRGSHGEIKAIKARCESYLEALYGGK